MTNHEDSSVTLSAKQAYAVMCEFTWRYLGSTAGDDLVQLIGDTEMIEDGTSFDPSAWDLWIACVEYVKAGGRPRAGDASRVFDREQYDSAVAEVVGDLVPPHE